tara:strand:- start:1 stop:180 length:180 start_codon:yes stop_codon:yes gene_type:complete
MTTSTKPEFVYTTYIRTTSEKLWSALTTDEVVPCYWFGNAWISMGRSHAEQLNYGKASV